MEDQNVELVSEQLNRLDIDQDSERPLVSETERIREDSGLIDENSMSNGTQECSPFKGHTLPILQKVIDINTIILDLKRDHAILSDQVKLTINSFPGPDILKTLRLLSTEHEVLKKKYLEESSERKQFYNEIIELKGNIRVFCRCRPLNQNEIANGCNSVIELDSSQDNELQVICSDSSKKKFKFDHVFQPEDNQDVVFAQTKPIVTSVLDGYNVCIFAYGQTGTGKTFTMEGTPQNRGVNYRTMEELFCISEERGGIMKYELFVSMLEVYNEKIRDLLVDNHNQPSKKLEIKQGVEGKQEVPRLVEARVFSTDDVWELLKSGSQVRSVGSTTANELSSRSHCLFRVTVKGENLMNGQRTRSHLWLVDLAGSERVGKIEVEGERLKESQYINKSLSALGDVISALASKSSHIPYRNSKLTHMLQSSLGGDCKILMFVQIGPNASNVGETLCSLNFASRVRGIESGTTHKQTDLTELFKYKQMADKIKHDEKETKKLQDNLQSLQLRLAAREHICRNLQEKVRDLENQLAEERRTRLKQETRAFAQISAMPPRQPPQKSQTVTEKKAPRPSKLRMPLRRITNFLPPSSPKLRKKTTTTTSSVYGKENTTTMGATNRRNHLQQPRRISIAVRPPPPSSTTQVVQPRRRVSISTLRPESPLQNSVSQFKNRPSMMRDPRKAHYSRLFSPFPELNTTVEMTPMAMRSSKFMGSPPVQPSSNKSRHPAIVTLPRKPVIWSPLKLRGMKTNRRPSLLPIRHSTEFH